MKNTIIFDLDGTLALIEGRTNHALKMGRNGMMNWNEVFNPANIAFDMPNEPVIKMAQLFSQQGFKIVILSGRSDKMFDRTVEWLEWNDVPFDKLVMRDSKTNHFTPDDVLKKDMLDKHVDINDVFLVVDDRDRVVKLWRSLGLTTFQVADGDFKWSVRNVKIP